MHIGNLFSTAFDLRRILRQESWELMFDTVDTAHDCIRIATGVISTIKIFPDNMLAGLSADMLATDLAEYLVRKGAPLKF